jgi:hypothetical protein
LTCNTTIYRLLACLLIFSLILISIAIIPLNTTSHTNNYSTSSSAEKAGEQTSINLILQNSIDCRESETFFQYHFLQNMLSKRSGGESAFPVLIVLNIVILSIIFSLFADEKYPLMVFMRISEYQHDKDGML